MNDLSAFGLGVLALLAVWKLMLRPSIQDTFKDQLFDIRDNLRARFASAGQLDTLTYKELRDTLNAYIRFVEVADLAQTYHFAMKLSAQPEVAQRCLKELDRRFEVADLKLAAYVRKQRRRCARIIQIYVFHSSFYAVAAIYLVLLPMAVAQELFKFCRERAVGGWRLLWKDISRYMRARENRTIQPQHTELFSQMRILTAA